MPKYCICRSSDVTGFMLGCDSCSEWFHGRCININKARAKKIDKYFCDKCRARDKNLPGYEATTSRNLQARRKTSHKSKSKLHARKQCGNPDCTYESRQDSKYCSDECGLQFNRLRYEKIFLPKWKVLEDQNHSSVRWDKFKELQALDEETIAVTTLIRNLKEEKEELERNIKIIKDEASELHKKHAKLKEHEDEDVDADNEDVEEAMTGDQARTFCITCGHSVPNHGALKHWFACHKKAEHVYNFTADVLVNHTCEGDENPKLYCQVQDKKSRRYCMHMESACPQHSNWHSDKEEVCGCPLNINQKLVPDGDYCLELKKDCKQHYHWDKFRLAQINMQRIHAFARHDVLLERKKLVKASLDDTYGGVVGVMLHNTINHLEKKENVDQDEVDVETEEESKS